MGKTKTLALKNAKDWKTTIMGIVGGIIFLAGMLWPDKINPETGEVIATALNEILVGLGVLIPTVVAIFGKD